MAQPRNFRKSLLYVQVFEGLAVAFSEKNDIIDFIKDNG